MMDDYDKARSQSSGGDGPGWAKACNMVHRRCLWYVNAPLVIFAPALPHVDP
jgi:hypothetical protein